MNSTFDTLRVSSDPGHPQRGLLHYRGRVWPCVLGRAGVSAQKREGDGATPAGRFPLHRLLYRADRLARPETALPVAAIARDDGWCDDPADPHYNRAVKLPYGARTETLWRDDELYDLVIVVGHNDDPVVPFAGSAVFMHVAATNGEPTAGCVALGRADLLALLRLVRPGEALEILEHI